MNVQLVATKFDLTPELEKYARAKMAQLMRKVPRQWRTGVVCVVAFSQARKKGSEFNSCSISFTVSGTELKAEETTLHMYSSLDIAAVHIANQLKGYADQNGGRHIRGILHTYVHRLAR